MDGSAVKQVAELAREGQKAEELVVDIGGKKYSSKGLHLVRETEAEPDTLKIFSLTGFVNYCEANRDELKLEDLVAQVVSPTRVDLLSKITGESKQRFRFVTAEAPVSSGRNSLGFEFGRFLDKETLNISLQALFLDAHDRSRVLQLIGTVQDEATAQTKDDGVTQKVEVKAGINLIDRAEVPNPVTLAPFRTFSEITQPASPFVLRIKKGAHGPEAALFEADGGAWQAQAIRDIGDYLKEQLPEDIRVLA